MGIEMLTDSQEQRLLKLAQDSIDRVNKGEDVHAVIEKFAREDNLSPSMIQRLCEAVNVGKAVSILKSASDPAAEFMLADASKIIANIFTEHRNKKLASVIHRTNTEKPRNYCRDMQKKALRDVSYGMVEKSAAVEETPVDVSKLDRMLKSAAQLTSPLRTALQCAKQSFVLKVAELAEHFRQNLQEFPMVDARAHGVSDVASHILDMAYQLSGIGRLAVKRASVKEPYPAIDLRKPAFRLLKEAVDLKAVFDSTLEDYTKAVERLSDFERRIERIKEAGLYELRTMSQLLNKPPDTENPQSLKSFGSRGYEDPGIREELEALKASVVLHNMMENDPVLANVDKRALVGAYNEIARFSPDILSQPLLMRAALRKIVNQHGVLDSTDAAKLKDVEKTHVGTQLDKMKTVSQRRELEPSWI